MSRENRRRKKDRFLGYLRLSWKKGHKPISYSYFNKRATHIKTYRIGINTKNNSRSAQNKGFLVKKYYFYPIVSFFEIRY